MARRHRRKGERYLGTRTWGAGNTKNRRGKGSKGGKGGGGLHKHKWTWVVTHCPDYFGAHGFFQPGQKEIPIINLEQIENKVSSGKLEKKEGLPYFEFKGKVLGTGKILSAARIAALCFSKKAEEKIKAAGGTPVVLGKGSGVA